MSELVSKAFAEEVGPLFEAHPVLKSFSWTQYTPYFNDGETCEFDANTEDMYFWFNDGDEEEDEEFEADIYSLRNATSEKSWYVQDGPRKDAMIAAFDFIQMFDKGDLEMMFGDHVRVSISKDGSSTEEYDHD